MQFAKHQRIISRFHEWIPQRIFRAVLAAALIVTFMPVEARAINSSAPPSLKTVPIPEPSNLMDFVQDRAAAIRLGKALFWDMQVGSDAVQSCATCHFQAGADNRAKNQISPGLLSGDTSFQIGDGPNHTLTPADFPFHKLSDPEDRDSAVISDANDVTSSQGVRLTQFQDVVPGDPVDQGVGVFDPTFSIGGKNLRRVEPRNSPTTINAVFFYDNSSIVANGMRVKNTF